MNQSEMAQASHYSRRDIVVIGGSAGGLEALEKVVAGLPADFPAAIFVVLHIPAHVPSELHHVLKRVSSLPVAPAVNGEPVRPGRIYTASADRHLMIEEDHVRLTRGPRESRSRPAVDVLFRSAAYQFGPRVIGIVLSGALDDGTTGLWAIKDRGGMGIVQLPEEAAFASMPKSAIEHVKVDAVLPVQEMPALLIKLTSEAVDVGEEIPMSASMKTEVQIALEDNALARGVLQLGPLSTNTCPECHGTMVRIEEGSIVRFRCHTGHAFSIQSLLAEVTETIDNQLWSSIRAIEERIFLLYQMAHVAKSNEEAAQCIEQAERARNHVELLRGVVLDTDDLGHDPAELPAQKLPTDADQARGVSGQES